MIWRVWLYSPRMNGGACSEDEYVLPVSASAEMGPRPATPGMTSAASRLVCTSTMCISTPLGPHRSCSRTKR